MEAGQDQAGRRDCSGGASLRVQPERGCGFSAPALRYGQPVGKQALIQEARPDPRWRLEEPLRSEPQEGNRYRFWGKIEEFKGRVLRVTTLEDKITIHNAFPDRGFKP